MTLPPPVQRGRARLDRTLADALPDLAWLSSLYAGGQLGMQLAQLHAAISAMREVMAQEALTDEEQP